MAGVDQRGTANVLYGWSEGDTSIQTLFTQRPPSLYGRDDSVFCQGLKFTAVIERAARLAEQAKQG